MPVKLTQEQFITKSKLIFGKNTYNYSKVVYTKSSENIILICKKHGDFIVQAASHLSYKRGC